MKNREIVEYKCLRCEAIVLAELDDAMRECGKHLFDAHKDDNKRIVGFTKVVEQ